MSRVSAAASRAAIASTGACSITAPSSKATRGMGSVWDIAFSNDAQQQFLFVPSGMDERVFVVRRDTLEELGGFGDGGRQPGLFRGVGSVAVDSKGNVYTGETFEGKRVQKWIRK